VADFLLEVGCEEMPAGWLAGVGEQLGRCFRDVVGSLSLEPEDLVVAWTPRRLVLSAQLPVSQPDRDVELWGPSLRVARSGERGWSKAALGFARKCGVEVDQLDQARKSTAKPGELYLRFCRREAGRATTEVLPNALASVLRGLTFPKRMNWDAWLDDGKGTFPFGRPIRWLLAALDGRVVPFTIYDGAGGRRGTPIVTSGDRSVGHRFLPRGAAGEPFQARSGAELEQRLRDRFVVLAPDQRLAGIESELRRLAGAEAAHHPLTREWRDLVEHPSVLVGRIPAHLQELPAEVLQTVLVHHQKYIPVVESGVVSAFAAVVDGDGANGAEIVRGMERVVVARLRDAVFFFREDIKRPLAERVDDLAGVTFHGSLGSYKDKAERLVRLIDAMAEEMGLLTQPERDSAREAALLAKADLTTLMVGEFPELQGVMGGIYLEAQGHPRTEVATAVRWHYHPQSVEEQAPPAGILSAVDVTVFAAVSLADKLDTLAGYFAIGEQPTGSRDPFGLRRAAQGVIRVLLDFWADDPGRARPDLGRLAQQALGGYVPSLGGAPAQAREGLETFLSERLEHILTSRGFPGDEVAAVLGTSGMSAIDDPRDCLARVAALHRVRSEAREDFAHLAAAFKRAKNILGAAPGRSVRPELFREAAEGELNRAVERLENSDGDYDVRLRSLAGLRGPVDRFFEDVLVMAEEPEIRDNRLGLLARALSLFYRIADISKLGG
jgi:glycyl-tRNA synthetase beta chain